MRGLTNYRRNRDLNTRFDSLFSDLWRNFDRSFDNFFEGRSLAKSGYPRIDIVDGKDLRIEASVPGLTKDQVSVEYIDEILTISGESQNETEDENRTYRELHRSKFSRSLRLDPNEYDVEKIDAEVKNGLLTVTIPKFEMIKPESVKKIEVRG